MYKILVLGSILAIVAGPVAVAQLTPEEPRQYQRVYLADVEYAEVTFRNGTQNLDLAGMLESSKENKQKDSNIPKELD